MQLPEPDRFLLFVAARCIHNVIKIPFLHVRCCIITRPQNQISAKYNAVAYGQSG